MHSKKDGSSDTLYAFEYWTEGEDWLWYEWPQVLYHRHFDIHGSEDQQKLGIVTFAVAALCVTYLLICCFVSCCKKGEKDKIHVEEKIPIDFSHDEKTK